MRFVGDNIAKGWEKLPGTISLWSECLASFLTQAPIVATTPANSAPNWVNGASCWAARQVISFVSLAASCDRIQVLINKETKITGAESRKSDRSDMSKTKSSFVFSTKTQIQ